MRHFPVLQEQLCDIKKEKRISWPNLMKKSLCYWRAKLEKLVLGFSKCSCFCEIPFSTVIKTKYLWNKQNFLVTLKHNEKQSLFQSKSIFNHITQIKISLSIIFNNRNFLYSIDKNNKIKYVLNILSSYIKFVCFIEYIINSVVPLYHV